jgi:hypothetical protein
MITWMTIGKVDENKECLVRFSYGSLGVAVEERVSERIANMLMHAKDAGRNEHIDEVRRAMEKV